MGSDNVTTGDRYHEVEHIIEAVVLPDTTLREPAVVKEFAEVRAPGVLMGGYELTVDIDGSNCILLVPEQGVQEGEIFRGEILRKTSNTSAEASAATLVDSLGITNSDPHSIPTGRWRDGLFQCCKHGNFHMHHWSAFCFKPVALGQVQNRMGLSICGERRSATNQQGRNNLTFMIVLTVVMWTLGQSVIGIAIGIFLLISTLQTRAHVRRTYNIPESRDCVGCEDFCCSLWCSCCVIAQMSRHTVDYDVYHPVCCTESGMDIDSPPTLPTQPIIEVEAEIV